MVATKSHLRVLHIRTRSTAHPRNVCVPRNDGLYEFAWPAHSRLPAVRLIISVLNPIEFMPSAPPTNSGGRIECTNCPGGSNLGVKSRTHRQNEPCSSLRPSLKSHPVEFPGCPSIVMDRFEWKEMDSNSPTSSIVPYQHRLNRGVIGCYRCAVCTHHARLIGILVSRMYLGQQRARATDITALLCSVPLRQFHLTAIATDNCSALLRSGSSTSPR